MSRPRARMGDADMFELREAQVEAKRAAVEARHDLMELEKGKGSAFTIERGRMAELHKLIQFRHRGPKVDTDDGLQYLEVAIPSLVERAGGFGSAKHPTKAIDSIKKWSARFTPGVTEAEITRAIREARSRSKRQLLYLDATDAGNMLELKVIERERLKIGTIRPANMCDDDFAHYQREQATQRERDRRLRNGATPQSESKAARRRALALKMGVHESTVRRKIEAGELTLPEPGLVREQVSCRLDPPVGRSLDIPDTKPGQHPRRAIAGACGQTIPERRAEVDPALPARVQREAAVRGRTSALARIRAGANTRLDAASRTVAVALPGGEFEIPGDLLSGIDHAEPTNPAAARATADRVIAGWTSGRMPDEVIAAIESKAVALGLTTRSALARSIGIDRGTWSNAARREFGLGADKVALVKAWLTAA